MTILALSLVLLGSCAHAGWNVLAKRANSAGLVFVWVYSAVTMVVAVPVTGGWLLIERPHLQWNWLLAGGVSALLHTTYALLLQRGYRNSDLSVMYPVARGSAPVLVAVAAVPLLGEKQSMGAYAGVGVVVLGVVIISSSTTTAGSRAPGVAWGLATGLAIAAYTLWDANAMTRLAVPGLPYVIVGSVVQFMILTLAVSRSFQRVTDVARKHGGTAVAMAILVPASYLLVLIALQLAPVTLVAAARSVNIVLGSLAGVWLLKEGIGLRRLVGAVLVMIGVGGLLLP